MDKSVKGAGSKEVVLAIDLGGSRVKVLTSDGSELRRTDSGPDLTPTQMVDKVRQLADGLAFDVISMGYPGAVRNNRPTLDPANLGKGWKDFDFAKAFGKPFKMAELIARVRGLVRRANGKTSHVVTVGDLRIDSGRMTAELAGMPLRLSPLEFRLLDYLTHQNGRAVSSGELADHLYGTNSASDANAIEALVARLRRKFGAGLIATRRGFGYVLEGRA